MNGLSAGTTWFWLGVYTARIFGFGESVLGCFWHVEAAELRLAPTKMARFANLKYIVIQSSCSTMENIWSRKAEKDGKFMIERETCRTIECRLSKSDYD